MGVVALMNIALMNTNVKIIIGLVFFCALFYAWPNYVHEPLHLLALQLQGSTGYITHGNHPSTTRTAPVEGVAGGLLFALLPSLISVILLFAIWFTRKYAGILFHIMLPSYLVFDLIINIDKFTTQYSDFGFLVAVPAGTWIAIAVSIVLMLWLSAIVLNSAKNMQVHNVTPLVWQHGS